MRYMCFVQLEHLLCSVTKGVPQPKTLDVNVSMSVSVALALQFAYGMFR